MKNGSAASCPSFWLILGDDGSSVAEVDGFYGRAPIVVGEPAAFVVLIGTLAIRLDRDGHRVGQYFVTGLHGTVRAAFDGTATILAWSFSPSSGIYTARLPSGSQNVEAVEHIADGNVNSLTAANRRACLTYTASQGMRAVLLIDGKSAAEPVPLPGNRTTTAVEVSSRLFALWADGRTRGAYAPFAEPFDVSFSSIAQSSPAVATDGASHVAVWIATDGATSWVEAGALLPDGNPSPGSGIRVSAAAAHEQIPAIAYGAGMFLVLWREGDRLFARRIDASLRSIDENAFAIADVGASPVAVAFDGAQWLVVFMVGTVRAVRIGADGAVVDSTPLSIPPSPGRNGSGSPAVGFDGTSFIVAWQDTFWIQGKTPVSSWISAARIGSDGTVGAVAQVSAKASSGATHPAAAYWITYPRIAGTAGGALIAWNEVSVAMRGSSRAILFSNQPEGAQGRRRAVAATPPTASIVDVDPPEEWALCSDSHRFYVFAAAAFYYDSPETDHFRLVAFETFANAESRDLRLDPRARIKRCSANALGAVAVVSHYTSGPPFGSTQRLFWWIP